VLQAPSLPSISRDSEDNGYWNGKHLFVGTKRRKSSVFRRKSHSAAMRRGTGSSFCPVRGRTPISRLITASREREILSTNMPQRGEERLLFGLLPSPLLPQEAPIYFAWKDSAHMPLHQETRRPSKCRTVGALPFTKISRKSWWRNNRLASLPGE
jgi:hypothetical protein